MAGIDFLLLMALHIQKENKQITISKENQLTFEFGIPRLKKWHHQKSVSPNLQVVQSCRCLSRPALPMNASHSQHLHH